VALESFSVRQVDGQALIRSVAVLVVLSAILVSPAANAATPQQLYSADSSGMLKITVVCGHKAHQYGSGFLLGPKLMMTARHVLVDPITGKSCTATAKQDGTRKAVRIVRWMAIRDTRSSSATDIAIGVLATPVTGTTFRSAPCRQSVAISFWLSDMGSRSPSA
jgi:hypothetical protein